MPLYKITTKGQDKPRLVDATSEAAALKHAAVGMFSASRVTRPTDAAALMASGITLEKAGVPTPLPETVDVETGNVVRGTGDKAEVVRPATLAELGEADPGATWRVDVKGGLVQRLPQGADGESPGSWEDVREATAEELAEAKKK